MTRTVRLMDNDPFTLTALLSVLADMSSCEVMWAVRAIIARKTVNDCSASSSRFVTMPDRQERHMPVVL